MLRFCNANRAHAGRDVTRGSSGAGSGGPISTSNRSPWKMNQSPAASAGPGVIDTAVSKFGGLMNGISMGRSL
jgi:hypothetical protein